MVAVIGRFFGAAHINLAEDIVQDALMEAMTQWNYQGIPNNPTAWLYKVAKNKALNVIQKHGRIERMANYETGPEPEVESDLLFTEQVIADDQVRMMFVCCHPSINAESQMALILKTLCGLSIGEIAKAFLTNNETINKRLVRARKVLQQEAIHFDLPGKTSDLELRLTTVLKTVYLLFNEGYSASHGNETIRQDLCLEAIRLVNFLVKHRNFSEHTEVHALLSLMYFNSSRFMERVDNHGNLVELALQDRSKWDQELILLGIHHLDQIGKDASPSLYSIMATISAYHCTAPSFEKTNWAGILALYDGLLKIDPSPIVQLNRVIALARAQGIGQAIQLLEGMSADKKLSTYLPYHLTLAEFYMEDESHELAEKSFLRALEHTKMNNEAQHIKARIEACRKKSN